MPLVGHLDDVQMILTPRRPLGEGLLRSISGTAAICHFDVQDMQSILAGNHFHPSDLYLHRTTWDAVMNSHTDNSEQIDRKTIRSISHAVGERLQQHLHPVESELPSHLARLMDELHKQDAGDRQTLPN